ncbi:hypothetical protein N9R79_10260 [Vibrio sp.]|nr:hypothetical protein [Vibrio sp.]
MRVLTQSIDTSLYPWFDSLWSQWRQLIASNRWSQVNLVYLPDGHGGETLISHWLQQVLCLTIEGNDDTPCGLCKHCELMAVESYPDVHIVQPASAGKSITVDQVRLCNDFATKAATLGGKKIIIIDGVEQLNVAASNALLKTLEEPTGNTFFLLIAGVKRGILPTILSRCQQWNYQVYTDHQLIQWLQERMSHTAQPQTIIDPAYLKLTQYAPLKTKMFLDSGETEHATECFEKLMHYLKGRSHHSDVVSLVLKDPITRLCWLWYWISDAQKHHFITNEGVSLLPKSKELSQYLNYNDLYLTQQSLSHLVADLKSSIGLNSELLITNWLLTLEEKVCL